MILPTIRDPRLITIRRGGSLTDADHKLLALWAASCAEHVLPLFESVAPEDPRPRLAIAATRAWAAGELKMMESRAKGAARFAAYAAGQAACVPHVPEHNLGAAAYAIKATMAAAVADTATQAGILERDWQRAQLPAALRALVLEDQQHRNEICWQVFAPPTP